MKALSIRQPWAWLIIHAPEQWRKPVENRTWFCQHSGNLLIHAAKACTNAEWTEAVKFVRRFNPLLAAMIPPPEKPQLGGIVGMVYVTGCVRQHSSPFFTGPFGILMTKPYPLPFLPMRGMLGLFNVNDAGEPEEVVDRGHGKAQSKNT